MVRYLRINNDPAVKPRINLFEARLVIKAVLAANPKTESDLDMALASIRAYGPLVGRCFVDETNDAVREHLFTLLILPRLQTQASFKRA